ncbi:hypothetical protein ACHAPT_001501 [Fusarium lateritium]
MSDLPSAFPCWTCVENAIRISRCQVYQPIEGEDLDKLLNIKCFWEARHFKDGRCGPCHRAGGKCDSAPGILQGNVKDVINTVAYINMIVKLDSPSRRQIRVFHEYFVSQQPEDGGFHVEDRVLPFKARQDIIAATTTLGIRLTSIIKPLLKGATKPDEYQQIKQEPLSESEDLRTLSHQVQAQCQTAIDPTPMQPRRLNASDKDYLRWNAMVRAFHDDVFKALQRANIGGALLSAIMENIPIKWIPAANEEALEVAKTAILKADGPAQPPTYPSFEMEE